MIYEKEEGQTERPCINAFSKIIGEEEINQWAKLNLGRNATSFILIMFLPWVAFSSTLDNVSLLTLSLITLAALLSLEVKDYRKTKILSFAKIVINGQAKLDRPSFGAELTSGIKYEVDEAFDSFIALKHTSPFYKIYHAVFEVTIRSFYPLLASMLITLAYSMLSTIFDVSISFDLACYSKAFIVAISTSLFLAVSFCEAKLSKPIYKKILSFK